MRKIFAVAMLCGCLAGTVFAEDTVEKPKDLTQLTGMYNEAVPEAEGVAGTMKGHAVLRLAAGDADSVKLKGSITAKTAVSLDPAAIRLTADLSGKAGKKKASGSAELYIIPEAEGNLCRIYFGMDTDKDTDRETEWKYLEADRGMVFSAFGLEEDREAAVSPASADGQDAADKAVRARLKANTDFTGFTMDENTKDIDGTKCYVLRKKLSGNDMIAWYESTIKGLPKSDDGTAAAAASGASSGFVTMAAPEGAVLPSAASSSAASASASASSGGEGAPEYDTLFRAVCRSVSPEIEVDIDAETFLRKRVSIRLNDNDWAILSNALAEALKQYGNIDFSPVAVSVREISLSFDYDYDKQEVKLPDGVSEKAKKIENVRKQASASVSPATARNAGAGTASASASASSASSSSAGFTAIPQPVIEQEVPTVGTPDPVMETDDWDGGADDMYGEDAGMDIEYGIEE